MSNFMIACILLNISKNNSGLKGITLFDAFKAGFLKNVF